MQLTFARFCYPITPLDMTITRVALTNLEDSNKNIPDNEEEARHGQMGRRAYIPYGMYIAYGFYSPSFAKQTGVTSKDLELFWDPLINMWDLNRSAARAEWQREDYMFFSMRACMTMHLHTYYLIRLILKKRRS